MMFVMCCSSISKKTENKSFMVLSFAYKQITFNLILKVASLGAPQRQNSVIPLRYKLFEIFKLNSCIYTIFLVSISKIVQIRYISSHIYLSRQIKPVCFLQNLSIMNCAHGEKRNFRKLVDERLQIPNLSRVLWQLYCREY